MFHSPPHWFADQPGGLGGFGAYCQNGREGPATEGEEKGVNMGERDQGRVRYHRLGIYSSHLGRDHDSCGRVSTIARAREERV